MNTAMILVCVVFAFLTIVSGMGKDIDKFSRVLYTLVGVGFILVAVWLVTN